MEGEDRNDDRIALVLAQPRSPSVWRARIETALPADDHGFQRVALRMEGEDRNSGL